MGGRFARFDDDARGQAEFTLDGRRAVCQRLISDGVAHRVEESLARSSAHLAYHVGQILLLARVNRGADWHWISIPRGGSAACNAAPDREKGFAG